jgi:hypothetical protein
MKVALELSGLSRIHPISAASWGRIIGRYQPDVYIHSWIDSTDTVTQTRDLVSWVFKPVALRFDTPLDIDVSIFPDRHWPCIDVYRSLSMWKSINLAHNMVLSSGKSYDMIIRGRMDWHVHQLDIISFDGVIIPFDADKLQLKFVYNNLDLHGFNDHFAYGPIDQMNKYINVSNIIEELYTQDKVDYCPENFLTAGLVKQNVPIMLQHMEHTLIR